MNKKPRLLLHFCCAPCSTHAIETLKQDYGVVLYFSNSNIYPKEEYEKRLEYVKKISDINKIPYEVDSYDNDLWMEHINGLELEREKGKRCTKCFEFNLSRSSSFAKKNNFDFFTTSLTISPHKDSNVIFSVGKKLGNFLEVDFKKNDGYKKSIELSKKYNLYRQNYCGCKFSMRKEKH